MSENQLTILQMETEIQRQVEFKFNEFKTALNNRVKFKYQQAFDMTQESNQVLRIYREIAEMINKEVDMPIPRTSSFVIDEKRKRKTKAVDKLIELMRRSNPNPHRQINTIVNIVEEAQNY